MSAAAGTDGQGLLDQLITALQHSLASAVADVFLITLGVVAVAWAATFS